MYQLNIQLCLEFQNSISLPFEHDINEANSILLYGSPISTITFLKEWNLLLGSYTLSWYTCVQTEEPCELQYTGIMSSNCHKTFTHNRTRFEELKHLHAYILIIKPTRCTNYSKLLIQVCRQLSSRIRILLKSCQQTCMTYTTAVCTVINSWWWTEELSKTCTVSFQNRFEKLVHLVGFIMRICHDAWSHERKKKICFWHVIGHVCLHFLNKNVCISVLRQGCLNVNLCSSHNMLTLWPTLFRPRTYYNHQ